jgi:hypothetical protein
MPSLDTYRAATPHCPEPVPPSNTDPFGVCRQRLRWHSVGSLKVQPSDEDWQVGSWCCPVHFAVMSGTDVALRAGIIPYVVVEAA